jgi:hypothetical protein
LLFSAGQLESTMLMSSARNSNLLAILDDDKELGVTVQNLKETLKFMQTENLRGFRLSEFLDPNAPDYHVNAKATRQVLKPEHFRLLASFLDLPGNGESTVCKEVVSLERISFQGLCYGTFQSPHYRDSSIIFRASAAHPVSSEQRQNGALAGVIDMIFESECRVQGGEVLKRIFLFVNEHLSVQRSRPTFHDPYRKYGFAAGFLCERQSSTRHIIELTQIVSHFALTTLPAEDLIHVMPVDRVGSPPLIFNS